MQEIRIGSSSRCIGGRYPCFIIAEAGSNHNGSLELAKKMIDVAKEAEVDAIKFQIFRAQTLYPNKTIEVRYLKNIDTREGLFNIIKKLEVPYEWINVLSAYAQKKKIEFMATPFDLKAVRILNNYLNIFKIASYEAAFSDLICAVTKTNKPILISTGGATSNEIDLLVNKLLKDYSDKLVLLHCIAKYPTPLKSANLKIIPYLAKKYNINVGYSDHTQNPIIAPVAAVALGAKVLEKHFTLSRRLPGPDHAFAVEPDELKEMVKAVRNAEKTLGNCASRVLQNCERELYYYKRCIYCKKDLPRGHKIKKTDLIVLRNIGIRCHYFNPMEISEVLGKRLKSNKKAKDILVYEDLR